MPGQIAPATATSTWRSRSSASTSSGRRLHPLRRRLLSSVVPDDTGVASSKVADKRSPRERGVHGRQHVHQHRGRRRHLPVEGQSDRYIDRTAPFRPVTPASSSPALRGHVVSGRQQVHPRRGQRHHVWGGAQGSGNDIVDAAPAPIARCSRDMAGSSRCRGRRRPRPRRIARKQRRRRPGPRREPPPGDDADVPHRRPVHDTPGP